MNRDQSYLLDINKFGQDVVDFVQDMDETNFADDRKTQSAVLYCITILGEATKRLSPEFRAQHPQIPWKDIAGMRDKCVHDYRQINIQRVWQVTQSNIPELLQVIQPLLPTDSKTT
jgi:uncharacterized protein with HEPN domain